MAELGTDSREHVGPSVNPVVAIRSILPSLAPAERRVAEQVLANPADTGLLSIGELAALADTSEATVVRFSKKCGFGGYPGLKMALVSEAGRSSAGGGALRVEGLDIAPDDSLAEVVAKVGALDAQAVSDTVAQLDLEVLSRVVDHVVGARRVEIYGIGASGLVATDLQQKLRRIGFPAAVAVDGHEALTSAAVLGPGDVALAMSHSGETLDIVDPIELARSHGATTVAVTNHSRSTLARSADLVLTTAVREATFRAGAMASRSAQLIVVDSIYLGVAQREYAQALLLLEKTAAAVADRRGLGVRQR